MIAPSPISGTVADIQAMVVAPGPPGEYAMKTEAYCIIRNPQNASEQFDASNLVVHFSVNASVDNPTIQADITFHNLDGQASPLMAGDGSWYWTTGGQHYLAPGGIILVAVTCTDGSVAGRYQLFYGRIDRTTVEDDGNEVRCTCRDSAGLYLDTMIPAERHYGSPGGDPAWDVMNAISTDQGLPTVELRGPAFDEPTFVVTDYPVDAVSVMEALRRLAQQFGWDVRSFPSGGFPVVTLYDPDRERVDFDLEIGPDRYETVEELSMGMEDVRNSWDVYWLDADGSPQGPAHVEDGVSIAKYGLRYARIYLQRAENIRDLTSATAFANFALADTKEPFATHRLRAPALPMVELNDVHQYPANAVHYDGPQRFAIVGYRQDFAEGHLTTTVDARGKPLGAYREYRLSVEPMTLVSTNPPDNAVYAPENTVYIQTDSIAFPA